MDLNCRNITNKNKNNDKNLSIKNLSLEIANTLNGLDGFLNLFNKKDLTDRNIELLNQAKYASFILSHQINSLNYLQEAQLRSPQINYFCLNLQEMLMNSINFFKNEYKDKILEVDFDYDNKIPVILYGDSLKINEVFNSLLETAFILANKKISFIVQELEKTDKSIVIRFKLLFNNNSYSKNKEEFCDDISFRQEIKKVDINFAICKELLNQLNSELIFEIEENNSIKFLFDIIFQLEEDDL